MVHLPFNLTFNSIVPRLSFSLRALLSESINDEQDDAIQDVGAVGGESLDSRPASPLSSDLSTPPSSPSPHAESHQTRKRQHDERDVFGGDSPLSTPPASPPPSIAASTSARRGKKSRHRLADIDERQQHTRPAPAQQRPKNSKQRMEARKSKKRRARKRQEQYLEDSEAGRTPQEVTDEAHVINSTELPVDYSVRNIPSTAPGYVAMRDEGDRVHTVEELLEMDFELIKWDGREAKPIVDENGVVVAALVGMPNDPEWEHVHQEAFDLLRGSYDRCDFTEECLSHRRGQFGVLNVGISFGGGRQAPANVSHSKARQEVADMLLKSTCFKRLAGFASRALATWMPKIYKRYSANLKAITTRHQKLRRNFVNSVWAAIAFNFGPHTVTAKHRDHGNLPHGICSVTALGRYNYVKGGHLVLWELGLVIEFPPGSTVLIPSAAISHSNTPIGPDELCCSFTQYSAGGLFRWVDQGYQKYEKYMKKLSKKKKKLIPQQNEARVAKGISLFSTLDELRGVEESDADLETK